MRSAKDKASVIAKAGKLKLDDKDADSGKYYAKARRRPAARRGSLTLPTLSSQPRASCSSGRPSQAPVVGPGR